MIIDQLIFVGFNGKAMALDRDTGEIAWTFNQMKGGNVTFLLDGDRLIASTNGYIYCLDPLTGQLLWHNPMKGYGTGITSLASVRGSSMQIVVQQAAQAEETAHNAAITTGT
jgi:outer membrane protein assembly factor BamB